MAAVAGIFSIIVRVADLAGDLALPAVAQWEAVQLQWSWCPRFGCVAVLAIQSEESSMDGWLSMALDASFGRTGEGKTGVTIVTRDFSVPTFQREDGLMLETGHTVHAVVARGTVPTILLLVLGHASSPFLSEGVTAHAAFQVEDLCFSPVAIIAR